MPYIRRERRGETPETIGELNYAISQLCTTYIKKYGLSYQTLNDLIGALECQKLELYRRVASPYEDKKCRENGEVYDVSYAEKK